MFRTQLLTSLLVSMSGSLLLAETPAPTAPPVQAPAAPKPVDMDAVSHIIGANLGSQLKSSDVPANLDRVFEGVKEGFSGGEPKYTQEQQQEIMTNFQNDLRAKAEVRQKELASKNEEIGAKFLEQNAKKEGVITTSSGLQYQIITEGKGPKPTATDSVLVNYKGSVINGTVFDESRGEPTKLAIARTVPGWQEALPMMPTGSKWKLFLPAKLGYGETQRGPIIEPNSVLIFDVELVEIAKKIMAVSPAIEIPGRTTTPDHTTTPATPEKP